MNPKLTGAEAALCALSFFRHRHDIVPRFKKPKLRKHQRIQQIKVDTKEHIRITREYIAQARALGFRGRFLDAASAIVRAKEDGSENQGRNFKKVG